MTSAVVFPFAQKVETQITLGHIGLKNTPSDGWHTGRLAVLCLLKQETIRWPAGDKYRHIKSEQCTWICFWNIAVNLNDSLFFCLRFHITGTRAFKISLLPYQNNKVISLSLWHHSFILKRVIQSFLQKCKNNVTKLDSDTIQQKQPLSTR